MSIRDTDSLEHRRYTHPFYDQLASLSPPYYLRQRSCGHTSKWTCYPSYGSKSLRLCGTEAFHELPGVRQDFYYML